MNAGDIRRPSRALVRVMFAMLLVLLAAPVFALGLGQLQVKSRPGQPLVAEIPIISSDPSELQGLQVRLASPATFRRVGLEPPQGAVAELQFTPAVDDRGRPVIRVTSRTPVQQSALTFLVEVDWGSGRLVREYSALIDPPRTVESPVPPPVQAPVADTLPVVQRRPVQPPNEQPASQSESKPGSAAPSATPATRSPSPVNAADAYTVRRGDTLGRIAGSLQTGDYTSNQMMLALLQANPEAFIGGDINRLRQGAVLRVPGSDALAQHDAAEATRIVRSQIMRWRAQRRAAAQVASAAAGTAQNSAAASTQAKPQRVAEARLEIAPPQAAAGTRAGTQSGASAGGEGEMLRQELQQTKETLAARDAEVQELKTRLAELEQLQKDQQHLIQMKDGALASAQQKLATTSQKPADAGAVDPAASAGLAWWWLLPVALLVGLTGWWVGRRRAGMIASAKVAAGKQQKQDRHAARGFAAAGSDRPETTGTIPLDEAPVWAAGQPKAPVVAASPAAVERAPVGTVPAWMTDNKAAPVQKETSSTHATDERIELAQLLIQRGDIDNARSLLHEVIAEDDAPAREEATRVLQTLDR